MSLPLPETQLSKQSLGKYCHLPEVQLLGSGNTVLLALVHIWRASQRPRPIWRGSLDSCFSPAICRCGQSWEIHTQHVTVQCDQ